MYIKLLIFSVYTKKTKKSLSVKISGLIHGSRRDFTIESFADIGVLKELFLDKEYEWELPSVPKRILDLGAHWGDTSLYYSAVYPEAHIYSVEPSKDSYDRLSKHTSVYPNIQTLHAAVADRNGYMDLHMTPSSLGNSLVERDRAEGVEKVPVYTLPSLMKTMKMSRLDLCKFDIEGAEQFLFSECKPIEIADYFIGEIHEDMMDITKDEFTQIFVDSYDVYTEPLPKKGRYTFRAIRK